MITTNSAQTFRTVALLIATILLIVASVVRFTAPEEQLEITTIRITSGVPLYAHYENTGLKKMSYDEWYYRVLQLNGITKTDFYEGQQLKIYVNKDLELKY